MLREMLKSKIHRARVTEVHLHYEGSITIDKTLMDAADLVANEKVAVFNLNNGTRAETYVIEGIADSGQIGINGALARLAEIGDLIIIASFAHVGEEDVAAFRPRVVKVNERNEILK